MADPRTPESVQRHLEKIYTTLDPVRLLRDMRATQLRLAEIAGATRAIVTDEAATPPLDIFLAGPRTAWKAGEVRPTARAKPREKRGRRRPDPLVAVTAQLQAWFEAEPWRTGGLHGSCSRSCSPNTPTTTRRGYCGPCSVG